MVPERNSTAPIDIKPTETTIDTTDNSIVSPFTSPVKLEQLVGNEALGTTADNSSEYFYDFQAENFHAEQVSYSCYLGMIMCLALSRVHHMYASHAMPLVT